jgi:flagellar biosynthesis protein FlhG
MGSEPRARRYAIISGKGGVGKSVLTANLAAAFSRAGQRTLVIDADLGLANLDVILGVNPAGTIQDVLAGRLAVEEALVHTRAGFDLLPAGSGALESSLLTPTIASCVRQLINTLELRYDAILFDAGAGVGEVVLFFARLADEIVLVVTPEPTSLMDAYATVKILARRFGCADFRLVVNQADPHRPEESGASVAKHLQQVVTRFLSADGALPVRIHHAGSLPKDPAVGRSISRQQLLLEIEPKAPVAVLLPRLVESLRTVGTPASAAFVPTMPIR